MDVYFLHSRSSTHSLSVQFIDRILEGYYQKFLQTILLLFKMKKEKYNISYKCCFVDEYVLNWAWSL